MISLFTSNSPTVDDSSSNDGEDIEDYSYIDIINELSEEVVSVAQIKEMFSSFFSFSPALDGDSITEKANRLIEDIWIDISTLNADNNFEDVETLQKYVAVLEFSFVRLYELVNVLSRFCLPYAHIEKFGLESKDIHDVGKRKLVFNLLISPESIGYEYPQNGRHKDPKVTYYSNTITDEMFRATSEAELNNILAQCALLPPLLQSNAQPLIYRSIEWLYGADEED